jgi:hypothetical protein
MWERRRLTTLWASTACYRDSFTITFKINTAARNAALLITLLLVFKFGECNSNRIYSLPYIFHECEVNTSKGKQTDYTKLYVDVLFLSTQKFLTESISF